MLDFALWLYNNHHVLFLMIIICTVILEGPITILLLSIAAPTLWLAFWEIFIFSMIGEIWWDVLHYTVGRLSKNAFRKHKNQKKSQFQKFEKYERSLSLFEKILIIKYTPPITSIGLLYLGFQHTDFKKFFLYSSIFSLINGTIFVSLGYFFWNKNFKYWKSHSRSILSTPISRLYLFSY